MGRVPCCDKSGLQKGPWTPEEDLKLTTYIQTHGPRNWRTLPKNAGLQRCGKSCRLRWTNYLRPDIKRERFSLEEEESIIQLHRMFGNKWSAMAARLPGRTDNAIKNYWNTHIRKRLLRNGIDPVTHSPRLDLLNLSSILNPSLSCTNLLSLSNLLNTQALLNPEMLRLASTILSLKNEQPEFFSQIIIPENAISNNQPHPSRLETPAQQVPTCITSNVVSTPFLDQTLNRQSNNVGEVSSEYFANLIRLTSLENSLAASLLHDNNFAPQPNSVQYNPGPSITVPLENTNFHATIVHHQNLSVDSIISTPLSNGTNLLNSSSAFVYNGIEDDKESYRNGFLKFEIPKNLFINNFM